MARICKHGDVLGTIEGLTKASRYMSDGTLLVNRGFGWKLAKVKAGVTINAESFARAKERQESALRDRPALAEYRRQLHDLAGVSKRWKLHAAVTAMPDDCDGVWSEACDGYSDNVSASVDEVSALCRAYKVAVMENNDIRKEQHFS
jgi:hypothetical protein